MNKLKSDKKFIEKGGDANMKGYFITSLCGNIDQYYGMGKQILKYLLDNKKTDYWLLHVEKSRKPVIKLYKYFNFKIIGTWGNMYIMKKMANNEQMNIKLIKKLGVGFNGTVFLAELKKKKYIYKIEKLDDFEQGLKSIYHRQIDFDKTIASKHPDKFMALKSYGIIEECRHKQPTPKNLKGKWLKHFIKKNNFPRCYYLLYSPVLTGTFTSIKRKLIKPCKEYYSMFYQIVEGLNIMRKAGYAHQDIHGENIMYLGKGKSAKKWYIIDYGEIGNKKYPVSEDDIIRKEYISSDLIVFLWNCAIDNSAEDYAQENRINQPSHKEFISKLKALPEYKSLRKYLPKTTNKIVLDDCLSLLLCVFHYPLYKRCLGFTGKKWDKFKLVVPNLDLILYCIKHCIDKNYTLVLKKIKFIRNEPLIY